MSARYKAVPMIPELAGMMERWTAMVERMKARGRCRGCALKRGTAANRCGNTASKLAYVLVFGGDFRCHHARSATGPVVSDEGNESMRQCRGFRALLQSMRVKDGE